MFTCIFHQKRAHYTHKEHEESKFVIAKARIGIPLGSKDTSFSRLPHYAMEKNYFDAITKLGGLPIPLPYNDENFEEYLGMIDGILLPGGSFASPTKWYDEDGIELVKAGTWSHFYEKITKTAIERNIPILGICAGMQFLSGVTGGKMTTNVMKNLPTTIDHLNGADKEFTCHKAHIKSGTLLHKITNTLEIDVNSAHTEAVTSVGAGVIISAKAEDGCIEAIELVNHPFALGVQWHPEFFCDNPEDPHYKIMKALINVSKSSR
tara:strand:+ start:167738 stop:168529 length:792 start_codon:yes stop_codon:yes gene_type:complete